MTPAQPAGVYQVISDNAGNLNLCLSSGGLIAIIPPMGNATQQRIVARRLAAVDVMYSALADIAGGVLDPDERAEEALQVADGQHN